MSAPDLAALAATPITRSALTPAALAAGLAVLGARWTAAGGLLRLTLPGPMTRTGAVAARAGALADELDHHPTIELAYGGLALAISTHDADALTALDLVYAARLEAWLRATELSS